MIIVTGGAGFIGSNILAGLEKSGYNDLVVVDYLGSDDKWKNIAKRTLKAVIAPEQLDSFLSAHQDEISAIIHMGAISATTETDVDLILRSNIQLSTQLWDFCRDYRKQFIFASSAATYGDGDQGFDDNDDLEFLNKLQPLNPYGWSKHFIDKMIANELRNGRHTPPQYAGLKFFNVYGPNEYHKGGQKSVVAHIYPSVRDNQEVLLFKSYNENYQDGQQLRDFVWVGDCVEIILWLLKNPHVSGLFNVGTGQARSFYDLAAATWAACGKAPQIGYKDMPETLKDKYQYFTEANMAKLRKVGYEEPMTSLEDGVATYVQQYLSQSDSYL